MDNILVRDIIIKPIVTEKSLGGVEGKKYVFKVAKNANKFKIKEAVEKCFGVKVDKVNVMNVRGRYKRQGLRGGYTASSKKAIVSLSKSSKTIEYFESIVWLKCV